MSIPLTPEKDARRKFREERKDAGRRYLIASLSTSLEESTGKKVAKVVVHYEDKTQETLRPEDRARRAERHGAKIRAIRKEAREARRRPRQFKVGKAAQADG